MKDKLFISKKSGILLKIVTALMFLLAVKTTIDTAVMTNSISLYYKGFHFSIEVIMFSLVLVCVGICLLFMKSPPQEEKAKSLI